MTPEEANANLMQKRRFNPPSTPAIVSDEAIAQALKGIRTATDAEIAEVQAKAKPVTDAKTLLKLAQLPRRHLECPAVKRCGAWGETFDKLRVKTAEGFLIALVGNRGSGKTQLGVELIRESAQRNRSSLFATATRFFMEIKATYRRDAEDTEEAVVRRFAKPDLLVLDEIGKRGETDWENRLLFELLNDRYNAVKDTLLISNHKPEDFEASVGPSLVSRINETGGIIDCNWETFRR